MRRACRHRECGPLWGCVSRGLILFLIPCSSSSDAAAQAIRSPAPQWSAPIRAPQIGEAAALDRVAFAIDGVESDHGSDPKMWGPEIEGPQGPMQVSAAAAADAGGGDRFDEQQNRMLGRAYLALLYRRYRSWPDAVAAYNWGPGHLDSWISAGRPLDKLPSEVERYRVRVLIGSSPGATRLRLVHQQPRRPAADPHNGRGAVERLYAEIMRASDPGIR
jgi:Transglycosylase SLT domain